MNRARILLVDDDLELLEAVRIRLSKAGFDVLTANDGIAALDKAQSESPDLIVLDINMPGRSGHDVAGRIKADPDLQGTPVVFLSACVADKDFDEAWAAGVDKYIIKPFQSEELVLAIEDLLAPRLALA